MAVLSVFEMLSSSAGKQVMPESINTTFEDVIGCDEAISELLEIWDFLKNPSKYISRGLYLPKGILLSGPPGTGKTLIAWALAGETNAAFYTCAGSEFD